MATSAGPRSEVILAQESPAAWLRIRRDRATMICKRLSQKDGVGIGKLGGKTEIHGAGPGS